MSTTVTAQVDDALAEQLNEAENKSDVVRSALPGHNSKSCHTYSGNLRGADVETYRPIDELYNAIDKSGGVSA